jgi:LuxR family quorum-sensing system transcriptional regulator CciR
MIEQFIVPVQRCATMDQLKTEVGDAAGEIGFDFFAITFCDNLRTARPRFQHLDNYPLVYAERFVANHLYREDPILHAAQRRIGGFAWKRVGDILPLKPAHSDILDSAAREGLRDGYTIPANVPGEPCGAVSFASRQTGRLTQASCWCADAIGRTAFQVTRELRGLCTDPPRAPHLNTREIQTMRRLTIGESDKQIARALGISPETVRQYVKMARAAYGARTRTELVVRALRDGHIRFDEDCGEDAEQS